MQNALLRILLLCLALSGKTSRIRKEDFVFAGSVVAAKGYDNKAEAQTPAIRETANRLRFAGE